MLLIRKPTLLLDKKKAIKNIQVMAKKARESSVRFRPHFKTHQSAVIGEWFRKEGVESITVSSVDMAIYFANHGWDDITIAFPVNILEIDTINELARRITLNLVVESLETVYFLRSNLTHKVNVWIEIDVGYKRSGVFWDKYSDIIDLVREIANPSQLVFSGLLTHSGHSYYAQSKIEVKNIYFDTVSKLQLIQTELQKVGFSGVQLSIGDTPTCSVVEKFEGVGEIRPGNFVFYDCMQMNTDSCTERDIAVGVACPIVALYKDRNEIVIYGGAIHFSKDFILKDYSGETCRIYGHVCVLTSEGWSSSIPNTYVISLSQEHGIIKTDGKFLRQVAIGDVLVILPVHSCLTADSMKRYLTLTGEYIEIANYI